MKLSQKLHITFWVLLADFVIGYWIIPALWRQGSSSAFDIMVFFVVVLLFGNAFAFAIVHEVIRVGKKEKT